jgi:predicted choloylglycine hydrolase
MPLYEFECVCGESKEDFRFMDEAHKSMRCICGKWMKRNYNYGRADTDEEHNAYYNVGTGIRGTRTQHRKHAKMHGMEEVGTEDNKAKPFKKDWDLKPKEMRELANEING